MMDSTTLTNLWWKKDKNGIEFLDGKIVTRIKDVCNQSCCSDYIKLETDNLNLNVLLYPSSRRLGV